MSLLTVVQALAKNVGMDVPVQVYGLTDRRWQEAHRMADEAGDELARRVDWSALARETSLAGTGASAAHALPADFDRMQRGVTVRHSTGTVRPLTRHEWNTLTPTEGDSRYFLLENDTLTLWPYLASGDTVTVHYQTRNWTPSGDGYFSDGDVALMDEDLLAMGLIARWRRQKGMPYQDFEAEYEAALQDRAGFDRRARY